jgi:hypothetical protein
MVVDFLVQFPCRFRGVKIFLRCSVFLLFQHQAEIPAPPSTTSVCPFIPEAADEHKN